ncbi:pentatricopeptide repeat-containing protein chloroplastic [Dorcoceras hygrometricum]|uniref:Pentatricopeptide repeat-containing protein chloroplastic n=1 Tax=Dorcoceras hygrometricum TaxID=472368 RepID=A0A2Z7CK64_9LAMI|nr:pentatricopeptide repeat-containing protein chloroplastic [Dorcoceras hygrometricum]
MAVFAKISPISLQTEPMNLRLRNSENLKGQSFTQITCKSHQSPRKICHPHSLLNSSTSFTSEPNSLLTQLCIENQLNQAIKFLNSIADEPQNDIEEETLVSLVRLCEFQRASNEGSLVYSFVSNLMTRLSLKLGNALLSMFVRLGNLSDAWYYSGRWR